MVSDIITMLIWEKIILILGKFLSLFHSQKTKQKKDNKKIDEKGFKNGEKTLKNDEKALKKGKVDTLKKIEDQPQNENQRENQE